MGREAGKNARMGNARRRIRFDVGVGVRLEVRLHRFKKKLKWR